MMIVTRSRYVLLAFSALFFVITAPAGAQSFFDRVAGGVVDTVNRHVIKEAVPEEARRLQVASVKVALRGSDSDWDELIAATQGGLAGSPTVDSPSARSRPRGSSFAPPPARAWEPSRFAAGSLFDGTVAGQPVRLAIEPCRGYGFDDRPVALERQAQLEAVGRSDQERLWAVFQILPKPPETLESSMDKMPMSSWRDCRFGRVMVSSFTEATPSERSIESAIELEFEIGSLARLREDPDFRMLSVALPELVFTDVDGDGSRDAVFTGFHERQGGASALMHVVRRGQSGPDVEEIGLAIRVVRREGGEFRHVTTAHYRKAELIGGAVFLDGEPLARVLRR